MSSRWTAVLLAAALVAGCSREKEPQKLTAESAAGAAGSPSTAAKASSDSDSESLDAASAASIALLEKLSDRDETVLEAARLAVARREQLKVSADARRLLLDVRKESNRLLGMLKGEYRATYKPAIAQENQQLLDSLNGAGMGEFDRIFLGIVAKHYEDDAQIIERSLATVTPKLRETMTEVRTQRVAEAAEFRKQLNALGSSH